MTPASRWARKFTLSRRLSPPIVGNWKLWHCDVTSVVKVCQTIKIFCMLRPSHPLFPDVHFFYIFHSVHCHTAATDCTNKTNTHTLNIPIYGNATCIGPHWSTIRQCSCVKQSLGLVLYNLSVTFLNWYTCFASWALTNFTVSDCFAQWHSLMMGQWGPKHVRVL